MNLFSNPLTQHVSGTTLLIFRSARLYIAAYVFQHLMLMAAALGSRAVGSVHRADDVTRLFVRNLKHSTVGCINTDEEEGQTDPVTLPAKPVITYILTYFAEILFRMSA